MNTVDMPKIKSEADLLNVEIRKQIIQHFDGARNQRRKDEAFKAYECLKDRTINYVYELLCRQFDESTVNEMQYAMSNLSILRKVIDKLAKVYASGVKRTMPLAKGAAAGSDDTETQALETAAQYLKINAAMKKCNRYYRAFRNALVFVKPMPLDGKFDIGLDVLPPFKYDAIEDPDNHTRPLAIVLSDYVPRRKELYSIGDAGRALRGGVGVVRPEDPPRLLQAIEAPSGIGPDSNGPGKDDARRFVWWTKSFHFTTNVKGELIDMPDGADGKNPIAELPFVNFAGEQDGSFWAEGGEDLVDTSIKINVGITNVEHVGVSQGYGQLYMIGKNLPKSIKVGPNHCVQIEQNDKEDPTPQVGYLNSSPPLSELKELVEMRVALMLSTNNLSTTGFSTSLQHSKGFASGVALMIDQSESVEDIDEQSKVFVDKEPEVWVKVAKWFEVYASRRLLTDAAAKVKLPKDPSQVQLAFPSPKPMLSEVDELTALQLRKNLGLNTEVELIMRDDPSLTTKEAEDKLAKIKAEKKDNAAAFGLPGDMQSGGGMNGNQGQGGDGQSGKDNFGNQPNGGSKASGAGQDPNQK